jgi:hypothetical protein
MIYHCIKYHNPSCNGSLVIAIKLKAKYRFSMGIMLFHALQKYLKQMLHFLKIIQYTKFHSISATPTSGIHREFKSIKVM